MAKLNNASKYVGICKKNYYHRQGEYVAFSGFFYCTTLHRCSLGNAAFKGTGTECNPPWLLLFTVTWWGKLSFDSNLSSQYIRLQVFFKEGVKILKRNKGGLKIYQCIWGWRYFFLSYFVIISWQYSNFVSLLNFYNHLPVVIKRNVNT